jgi:hypothetical protein
MRVAVLVVIAALAAIGGALGTWALVEHYEGGEPSVTPEPTSEGPRSDATWRDAR